MIWQCPICKQVFPVAKFPIHCVCGFVGDKTQKHELIFQRNAICLECRHYNKLRCSLIDLGCKKTYIRWLKNPKKACPIGFW